MNGPYQDMSGNYPGFGQNSQNCIIPYQGITLSPYSYNYLQEPSYQLKVRKVENGFILLNNGKEQVFNTIEGLLSFIKQTFKEGK